MNINQRVVLICSPPYGWESNFSNFPPISAIGSIVSEIDHYNECDVLFDNYPCIGFIGPSWIVSNSFIVPIDDHLKIMKKETSCGEIVSA